MSLSAIERALVEHVERGELLDLTGEQPGSRTIRACVVRDIMRGRLAPEADPHGLCLRGARIAGRVDLDNVTSAVPLRLTDCLLDEGLSANDAHLAGLALSGCRLEHPTEPALDAPDLTVPWLNLRHAVIIGHSPDGAVRLLTARIGGVLTCRGAVVRNDAGPALHGDRLQAGQDVFLRNGFEATGSGELAAIRLAGADIGGQLDCTGAMLRNDSGPALDLAEARVGGRLVLDPAGLDSINVDGLTYSGLPRGIPTREWLRLLRDATPNYAAQPYQQLAAAHRAAGHDREARHVLMEQRRDQIRRGLTGRGERAWARLTGLTLGYGYQPWRALVGLLAVITTAAILTAVLGAYGGLAQVPAAPGAPAGCTLVERVGVGLDLGTPLVSTGARSRCDTTDAATGQILTITGWALRLLAWAFATLFIAGFTGAVRKT
ncbi:MAG TPA: hypothetical protein VHC18_19395 [Amycolatopsis sp.]|nr:hypothetical protein [Amycolatopsis sp.]